MGRRQRDCYLCGSRYQYCPTCSQDRTKPSWMSEFHSENCKDIFDICTRFNMEFLTKEEAKSAIKKCDLSNKENFRPSVQKTLSNLLKVDVVPAPAEEPKKRGKRIEVNPIDDFADIQHEVVKKENE